MAWASRGSTALGTLTSDVWDPELSGRVCCFLGILVALAGWWGGHTGNQGFWLWAMLRAGAQHC